MSVPWDSSQSLSRISYAPQSTATEQLTGLVLAAALSPFLAEATAWRPQLVRSPRSNADEQLLALTIEFGVPWNSSQSLARAAYAPANDSGDVLLALAAPAAPDPVITGAPWNSSQSLARAFYAPASQSDDVLLALVTPFGPWLDTPPAISRYTIITLAQEDAAELQRIAPPGPYFDMSEPWVRGKVIRSELLRLVRVHDDALPGIGFTNYFLDPITNSSRVAAFRLSRSYRIARFPR